MLIPYNLTLNNARGTLITLMYQGAVSKENIIKTIELRYSHGEYYKK